MRKPISFIVALLVTACVWVRVADAGYDARASELRAVLKKKELADDKEREVLTKALDEYLSHRQECLDSLVRIIAETSADAKQEQAWLYRLDGCREDAARLGEAVKSISGTPSIGAFNFVGVTQVEEVNFFTNLTKTKVGERRDKIAVNGKNVADMTSKLDEKWRYLFDQDNSLDEYEKRIVEQVGALIDESLDESDKQRRTIKEQLVGNVNEVAKFVKKWGKGIREALQHVPSEEVQVLRHALEGIEKVAPAIDAYAKIYLKTNADYIARSADYASLLQSEKGGIYVLFGGFRRDTEEFLKTNGFDLAKIDYQAASDALSSWASSSATSGQKSDAESFSKEVLGKLSTQLSVTEKAFNEFVSHHKSKFFGPIAPEIKEALAETRVWEDWNRMMQGKSLDSKLRQWRSEANTFFDVSLAELSSDDQAYLKGLLRERTDELVRSLQEAEKLPEKFKHDFDRSRLGDDIR